MAWLFFPSAMSHVLGNALIHVLLRVHGLWQTEGVHGVSQLLLNYGHEVLLSSLFKAHIGQMVWRDEQQVRPRSRYRNHHERVVPLSAVRPQCCAIALLY